MINDYRAIKIASRRAVYSRLCCRRVSVCLPVSPSATSRYSTETAGHRMTETTLFQHCFNASNMASLCAYVGFPVWLHCTMWIAVLLLRQLSRLVRERSVECRKQPCICKYRASEIVRKVKPAGTLFFWCLKSQQNSNWVWVTPNGVPNIGVVR